MAAGPPAVPPSSRGTAPSLLLVASWTRTARSTASRRRPSPGADIAVERHGHAIDAVRRQAHGDDAEEERAVRPASEALQGAVEAGRLVRVVPDRGPDDEGADEPEGD